MTKKFKNINDLLEFSEKIIGLKVGDVIDSDLLNKQKIKNKGKMGQIVEKGFFEYDLNSESKPDFDELGVELKVAPLKTLKNNSLVPKERIKITQVNHEDLIENEDIRNSKAWKKLSKLLLIWYKNNINWLDNSFEDVQFLELEKTEIFKQIAIDWKKIRSFVLEGKMHYISESSTKFLGVVRNGSGKNEEMISQPNSLEKYYRRAIALKICLTKIIYSREFDFSFKEDYMSYAKDKLVSKRLIELINETNLKYNEFDKSLFSKVIYNVLGECNRPSELTNKVQAEYGETYQFKVIPLLTKENGEFRIKEQFKINVNLEEQVYKEWEETDYSKIFENNFIMILYQHENIDYKFSKIIDIVNFGLSEDEVGMVKEAFEEFKFRYFNGGLTDENKVVNFIKSSDDKVVHFRPSAKDSKDTLFSAYGEEYKKTKIWLNNNIISQKIIDNIKNNIN